MGDKFFMENVLYGSKVTNDLYMHGVVESSTEKITILFNKILQDTLKMHNELYKAMEESEMYIVQNVEESKIIKSKQKLEEACQVLNCEEE